MAHYNLHFYVQFRSVGSISLFLYREKLFCTKEKHNQGTNNKTRSPQTHENLTAGSRPILLHVPLFDILLLVVLFLFSLKGVEFFFFFTLKVLNLFFSR